MLEFTVKANTPQELVDNIVEAMGLFMNKVTQVENPPLVEVPKTEVPAPKAKEPQAEPPKVEEETPKGPPAPPDITEVRAALRELRDRKGADAVKEILKAYGVDSLTDLKPEDYLGALARAKTEV